MEVGGGLGGVIRTGRGGVVVIVYWVLCGIGLCFVGIVKICLSADL